MTKPIERAKRPPMTSGVREAPFKMVRDTTVDSEPDGFTLDGYGAVFNAQTIIDSWEGRFRETIAPGSMKRSFRETPPRIQYDHGRHPMIGSIPIASLKSITEDTDPILAPDGGAHVVGRLLDNWLIQPVRDAIAANAINGMSFRFEVVREAWAYADGTPIKDDRALLVELERTWDGTVSDDELPLRTLRELKVPEIGPVMWPAYEATSVGVRNKIIDLGRLHEPEQRKLLARAVFLADSAAGSATDTGTAGRRDTDDDPATLAGALDATLDEACELLDGVDMSTLPENVAQACSLIVAAGVSSDALLEAMGVDDPDEADDEPRSKDDPDDKDDEDEPDKDTNDAPRSKDVDAQQDTASRKTDAQQTTAARPVGEHPSQPRGRRSIDVSLRTLRDMLQDISTRQESSDQHG
jgi:uncharacterized protein